MTKLIHPSVSREKMQDTEEYKKNQSCRSSGFTLDGQTCNSLEAITNNQREEHNFQSLCSALIRSALPHPPPPLSFSWEYLCRSWSGLGRFSWTGGKFLKNCPFESSADSCYRTREVANAYYTGTYCHQSSQKHRICCMALRLAADSTCPSCLTKISRHAVNLAIPVPLPLTISPRKIKNIQKWSESRG